MSSPYGEVQRQDWQDRDVIEVLSRNVKKISDFLSQFDQSCRGRLADLDEKVTNLERQMDFLESAISGAASHAANQPAGVMQSQQQQMHSNISGDAQQQQQQQQPPPPPQQQP